MLAAIHGKNHRTKHRIVGMEKIANIKAVEL